MEKASGGSFARTTRKTAEDEGRRRERFGHDAKQIPRVSILSLIDNLGAGIKHCSMVRMHTGWESCYSCAMRFRSTRMKRAWNLT